MRPPAWTESKSGRICGCWRCAVTRISLRNRSTPSTTASSGFSTLSATWRSCFRSRATKTVAIPPAPTSRSMAYRSASAVVSRSNASDIGHEDRARRGRRPDCLPPARDRPERVRLPGRSRGGAGSGKVWLEPYLHRPRRVVRPSAGAVGTALGVTGGRLCFSQCPLQVLHESEKEIHNDTGSLWSPGAEREKQVGPGRSSTDLVDHHRPSGARGRSRAILTPDGLVASARMAPH